MGKCLPNYINMEYYDRTYLTKDYVIVNYQDSTSLPHPFPKPKRCKSKKNELDNTNISSISNHIYNTLKFW